MLRSNPLLGVGPGNWPVVVPEVRVEERSVAVAGRRDDVQSVAEQRLGGVSVGARCGRVRSAARRHVRPVRARRSRSRQPTVARSRSACSRRSRSSERWRRRRSSARSTRCCCSLLRRSSSGRWPESSCRPARASSRCRPAFAESGPLLTLVCGVIAIGRSTTQLVAMGVYSASTRTSGARTRRDARSGELSAANASRRGVHRARRLHACTRARPRGARPVSERRGAEANHRQLRRAVASDDL